MSIRVSLRALQSTVAIVGLLAAASTLAGCSTFGMGASGDQVVTGSTGYSGTSNLNQQMPSALGTQVAEGPYVPPADIGSGSSGGSSSQTYASLPSSTSSSSISSQDLPVIGNTSSNGNFPAMSAQQSAAPVTVAPKAPLLANTAPNLSVVPAGTYTHVIKSGESLYTIAKHYNVTAQAIMQATGLSAPDKIFVGQRVVIPGRPDLLAAMDGIKPPAPGDRLPIDNSKPVVQAQADSGLAPLPRALGTSPTTHVASIGNTDAPGVPLAGRVLTNRTATSTTAPMPLTQTPASAAAAAKPTLSPAAKPVTQVATAPQAAPKMPLQEPAMSGADKFRWPVTGKVIVDFASSKGTGINIAAPAGTPVRAAENGTVIYVGSGVEGYGNLILIRHANGYVSAYANLNAMSVAKGSVVNRGDTIGTAGATGAVSSPQLHFELRKGATPVDPVPLLAAG
jgi:murein DD-endopeptidase MepM/ murein hydrolase activator NlpD